MSSDIFYYTAYDFSVKENSLTVFGVFLLFLFFIYNIFQAFWGFFQIPVFSKASTDLFAPSTILSLYPVISRRRIAFLVVTLPSFSR